MFTMTRDWLHQHCASPPAGWTAKQLAVLGVKWPPRKGWLSARVGKQIPDEVAREFERMGGRVDPLFEDDSNHPPQTEDDEVLAGELAAQ